MPSPIASLKNVTENEDFERYKKYIPIKLHVERKGL
jgi:hypothetical protein